MYFVFVHLHRAQTHANRVNGIFAETDVSVPTMSDAATHKKEESQKGSEFQYEMNKGKKQKKKENHLFDLVDVRRSKNLNDILRKCL